MVSFYLYIPAIIFAVWQFTERSRMERHARLRQRLQQVPQCIPRSMPVFAGLVAVSFVLRALWFFARGTDILGTQDAGASTCRSGLHCAEQILASFFNRVGQTVFFAAFAIIASFLRKWGQSLEQEGARISERDCVDLSFMLLSVYQALLQVAILLLFLLFDVGDDANGYEGFYLNSVVVSNVALAIVIFVAGCTLVSRLGALQHHRARDVAAAVAAEEGTRHLAAGQLASMPTSSRSDEAKKSLRQRVVLNLRRRLLGAENKRFRDAAALVLDRPEAVYLRDESAFLLGIINLMVTEAVVLTNPQGFWLWFLLWLPTLLVIRLWTYSRKGWQMFLLDFCYAANLLMVAAMLSGSPILFWAAFAVACGPVATAIVAWRNSLVFHDIDKTTTVVIHAFPALVAFCTRWFGLGPNGVPFCDSAWGPRLEFMRRVWPKSAWDAAVADAGTPCEPIPSAFELWVLGMVTYALWQAVYLLLTEVPWLLGTWLDGHNEVETSMRWLVRSKTGLLHRAARAVFEAVGFLGKEEELNSTEIKTKFIFVSAQLVFTGVTLLPGVLAAHWFEGCTTWLLLLLVGAAANGAQYYVQVFARRYAKDVEEKWAQTVEKAAQIAAEAATESHDHTPFATELTAES